MVANMSCRGNAKYSSRAILHFPFEVSVVTSGKPQPFALISTNIVILQRGRERGVFLESSYKSGVFQTSA